MKAVVAVTLAAMCLLLGWWAWPASEPAATSDRTVAALPPPAMQAQPASVSAPVAEPAARPSQATPTTGLATAAPMPRIGAEGYGPHIDRAQTGQDPQAAWEAVQWMRQCATNEGRRFSFEQMRNQGVSPEMMTQLMVEADAEARRCQTVTDSQRALLPELAARAMRAGLPEAASAYAGAVFAGDLTVAQRQEVTAAMRRDAQAGDVPSLLGALVANEAWGLTDDDRLTYLVAYAALGGQAAQSMAKALIDSGQIRFKQKPTPDQLEATLRNARPWLERLRAGGKG